MSASATSVNAGLCLRLEDKHPHPGLAALGPAPQDREEGEFCQVVKE